MNLAICKAQYSKITAIGESVKQLEKKTGDQYLFLNQGVNAVVPINLTSVIPLIDFNSKDIQVYPPIKGRLPLRQAVNTVYFHSTTTEDAITITSGGMSGLDLIFQTLDIEQLLLPAFYWGSYFHIANIRNKTIKTYTSLSELLDLNISKKTAVIICDPNNPVGDKFDDDKLLLLIQSLNQKQIPTIIDSPYRRVFYDNSDTFYEKISHYPSVIINESFSKSLGLSGQRIGFIHCTDNNFNKALGIRLMYASNGVNAFSQILIEKLLTTKEGKKATDDFKTKTRLAIQKNINLLKSKRILADTFYKDTHPIGIFVIVNLSEEELLKRKIAGISLSFFTKDKKEEASQFSRICVSVPHTELVKFF